MSGKAAQKLVSGPPTPVVGTARDAENLIRKAEAQLLGALIQLGQDDHAMRAGMALAALPDLDKAQAIVDGLVDEPGHPALNARLASARARVYDTARRIREDSGSDDPASHESWRECSAQAIRWRRRVTEIVPEQPTGWLDLGIALQVDDAIEAEFAFRTAMDLDPSGPVGRAASHYLDGSIAAGKIDSIPGLPRPAPPKEQRELTPAPVPAPVEPQAKIEDPRTDRRRRKLLGSIELLAAAESTSRSHLEKLRLAANSTPDSPEVGRAVAESWAQYGESLRSRKDFVGAGNAYLEARTICPTPEGIEELIVAVDKERASLADRKVRIAALVFCTAIAIFIVVWQITHYVPKE